MGWKVLAATKLVGFMLSNLRKDTSDDFIARVWEELGESAERTPTKYDDLLYDTLNTVDYETFTIVISSALNDLKDYIKDIDSQWNAVALEAVKQLEIFLDLPAVDKGSQEVEKKKAEVENS